MVELIGQRMSALTREQRASIELLALAEPLRLDEIVGLAGQECVTEAEALGVVTVTGPGALADVRLAHPLYGEVVRAELPVLRARGLRLRLAETLQSRDPLTSDDALRVARLLLDGGGSIPPDLVLDAAQAANLAGDPDLGARLAELALAGGAGLRATLLLAPPIRCASSLRRPRRCWQRRSQARRAMRSRRIISSSGYRVCTGGYSATTTPAT